MRRRFAWLSEQVGWFLGIAASLLMLVILLPLVPVFKAYDEVRRLFEDK